MLYEVITNARRIPELTGGASDVQCLTATHELARSYLYGHREMCVALRKLGNLTDAVRLAGGDIEDLRNNFV